jgi:OOP family OmpA-OmpF porin
MNMLRIKFNNDVKKLLNDCNSTIKSIISSRLSSINKNNNIKQVQIYFNTNYNNLKNKLNLDIKAAQSYVPPVPASASASVTAPAPAPAPASKVAQKKITLQADTLFDFDKSTLKSDGVATLNKVAQDVKKMKLEVVIIVGYTDSVGSDAYNIALGQRRANAVKSFLTNDGGVEATRVYTESKGKADPVASNATAEGRAKNRRAVIEVVGTQPVK